MVKSDKKRAGLVIKIGTSTLTAGTDKISRGKIEDIARQIVELREEYDITIVSSGAVALAKQYVNVNRWGNMVDSKQALSAIGQPKLMQVFNEVFGDFGLPVAQCLMTYKDFENPESRENTRNTINELIAHGYFPIINENDTTAVEELVLGDNDKLSALVAALVGAEKLIIASDIDGLFDKNPKKYDDAVLIPEISELDSLSNYIEEVDNGLGTGGMTTKVAAVRICFEAGVTTYLVNGGVQFFISKTLKGKIPFTKFIPTQQ